MFLAVYYANRYIAFKCIVDARHKSLKKIILWTQINHSKGKIYMKVEQVILIWHMWLYARTNLPYWLPSSSWCNPPERYNLWFRVSVYNFKWGLINLFIFSCSHEWKASQPSILWSDFVVRFICFWAHLHHSVLITIQLPRALKKSDPQL